MVFASGTDEVNTTTTIGHFGNSITVFEAKLTKASDMKKFLGLMRNSGILGELAGQEDARTDDACTFHFRLDKQKSHLGELALAADRDVIDVRLKVGVYPAKRESAVAALKGWLTESA